MRACTARGGCANEPQPPKDPDFRVLARRVRSRRQGHLASATSPRGTKRVKGRRRRLHGDELPSAFEPGVDGQRRTPILSGRSAISPQMKEAALGRLFRWPVLVCREPVKPCSGSPSRVSPWRRRRQQGDHAIYLSGRCDENRICAPAWVRFFFDLGFSYIPTESLIKQGLATGRFVARAEYCPWGRNARRRRSAGYVAAA